MLLDQLNNREAINKAGQVAASVSLSSHTGAMHHKPNFKVLISSCRGCVLTLAELRWLDGPEPVDFLQWKRDWTHCMTLCNCKAGRHTQIFTLTLTFYYIFCTFNCPHFNFDALFSVSVSSLELNVYDQSAKRC